MALVVLGSEFSQLSGRLGGMVAKRARVGTVVQCSCGRRGGDYREVVTQRHGLVAGNVAWASLDSPTRAAWARWGGERTTGRLAFLSVWTRRWAIEGVEDGALPVLGDAPYPGTVSVTCDSGAGSLVLTWSAALDPVSDQMTWSFGFPRTVAVTTPASGWRGPLGFGAGFPSGVNIWPFVPQLYGVLAPGRVLSVKLATWNSSAAVLSGYCEARCVVV